MSKTTPRIDAPQYEQLSLFADEQTTPAPGSLDIGGRIRAALKAAIKRCPRSRHHIAAAMSDALQHDVSKAQLDAWTSPSHEAHRFPVEYIAAFCSATSDHTLVETIAELAGGTFVPGPELVDLELGRLAMQERRLRERRKQLLSQTKEVA